MARPTGPVAGPAWGRFLEARRAHYRDGAPASVLANAAAELTDWVNVHGEAAGADFGDPRLPEPEEF